MTVFVVFLSACAATAITGAAGGFGFRITTAIAPRADRMERDDFRGLLYDKLLTAVLAAKIGLLSKICG
ncbi:MAG: hypothetical protein ACREYE_19550 [Gammaproteobacteria bacterium]